MPKPKKGGLGRGLSALMADVSEISAPTEEMPRADTVIPIELVHPNPDQPRRSFDADALDDLTNSIKVKGIIQPLILRADPDRSGEYQIVAGERRWRAAQRANLHEVPAIIREFNDVEVLEIAIIENIQRSDLNPVDEAMGYSQLMDRFGHTQEQLASALGKSRSHIANSTRLLSLPDDVKEMMVDGKLSAGHARALVGRENASDLAKAIVSKGLSVREAEKLTKKPAAKPKPSAPSEKAADTVNLERELAAHLNMGVKIAHNEARQNGTLTLSYKSLEQLDDLLRVLSGD